MRTFSIYVLFLILIGCSYYNENYPTITIPINNFDNGINLSDFFDSVKYVALETSDSSLIGAMGKIQYVNDYFFISDLSQNKILIFNSQGVFIRDIHKEGRGPGEYGMINDFTVSSKDSIIYVGDNNNKINVYSFHGDFVKSFMSSSPILSMNFIDDNLYIFSGLFSSGNMEERIHYATIIDQKGNVLQNFGDIEPEIAGSLNRITGGNIFVKNANEFLFNYPYQDTIYRYTNNKIKDLYYVDFGKYSVPKLTSNNIEKLDATKFRGYAYLSTILELNEKLYIWWINNLETFPVKYLSIVDFKNNEIKTATLIGGFVDDIKNTDGQFYIQMIDSKRNLIGFNLPVQCPVLARYLDLKEDDNPIISIYYPK